MTKYIDKMTIVSQEPLNAETPFEAFKETLTPTEVFYVRNHFAIPKTQAARWSLTIRTSNKERALSLDQVKQLPHKTTRMVLECAGNGRSELNPSIKGTAWGTRAVGQAEFGGISLQSLLSSVIDLPAEQRTVVFYGADSGEVNTGKIVPYARALTLKEALEPEVLLAWEMNDKELSPEHGYPLRLVVPGLYGMASVKWLQRIELVEQTFDGYFQNTEYIYRGISGDVEAKPVREIRPKALITSHQDGDVLDSTDLLLNGVAWSGRGSIAAVAVSLDGGASWSEAELSKSEHKYGWTEWALPLVLKGQKKYSITVRASDYSGTSQPLEQYWNEGGYGNNKSQTISLFSR